MPENSRARRTRSRGPGVRGLVAPLSHRREPRPGYTRAAMPRTAVAGLAASAAVLAVIAATERTAAAYPQWQLSSGSARGNGWHSAPAGGGLITSYGRDAIGSELSSFEGNGAFLHGKVSPPAW